MRDIPFNMRMTSIIHSNNHTRFTRVCNLARSHYRDQSLITELTLDPTTDHNEFFGLIAGLYKIKFGPDEYIMDLPISLYPNESIFIDSPFQAYTMARTKDLHVNLYKLIGLHDLQDQYVLEDTLNNHLDMLFINGRTIMPEGEPSLANPVEYKSMDNLVYKTVSGYDGTESELTLTIREPLRSMNNGLKDLMVVNSDVERHHITTKIGRTILSGYDKLVELPQYKNGPSLLFYYQNQNVGYANDAGNIRCTHFKSFKCSDITRISVRSDGIAAVSQEFAEANGFYNGCLIRISQDELVEYGSEYAKTNAEKLGVLIDRCLRTKPLTIEYVLQDYSRRVLLLDEYHVKTFYGSTTFIPADNTTEVSYFYKTLHVE